MTFPPNATFLFYATINDPDSGGSYQRTLNEKVLEAFNFTELIPKIKLA